MEKSKKKDKDVTKVKVSLGVKLIAMISLIVILALTGVTFIVSYYVSKDIKVSAEENNLTINSRTSSDCEGRINAVIKSTDMFMDLINNFSDKNERFKNASLFFDRYSEIAAIVLPSGGETFVNTKFFSIHEITRTDLDSYIQLSRDTIKECENGNFILKNGSLYFNTPVISIFSPIKGRNSVSKEKSVIIIYSAEELYESFSSGSINMSYFVNQDGEILIHPDMNLVMNGADFSENQVIIDMKESKSTNGQKYYASETGKTDYICAYNKIRGSNSAIITTVQLSIVLEGIKATTRRNLYLAVAILALVIMILFIYSRSISIPLRKLADIANEINQANFNTPLFEELHTKRHDELAVLMSSTRNERSILNTIARLTNIGVTRSIVKKEIDFNPHLKDITIFFSDIRGFTAISDGFNTRFGKDSGAEIIGFLNDYMSRMVQCITLTGGIVDKFEGDAIMACWGVLRNDNLDYEELPRNNPRRRKLSMVHTRHKKEDALSAVRACIAMRYALRKYNKDAEAFTKLHEGEKNAKYKPHIRIGSGLNSGRATVGFMGSWEKMEFTSIGDAVNLASRTESSNKPCGTDILITQDTYNLLKTDFIKCEENNYTIRPENKAFEIIVEMIPVSFEVKGKGKQHFYGVVNMPGFDVDAFYKKGDPKFKADPDCLDVVGPNGPKNLHEMRAILGIPEPDFGGVNLDESENKIQISAT